MANKRKTTRKKPVKKVIKDTYKIVRIKKLPLGDNYIVTNDGNGDSLKLNKELAERLIKKGFGEYIERV